jgi:hypothetical protein
MCFSRIASIWLAAVSCALAQSPAADLYVSPQGNDAWSGKLPAANTERTDGPVASIPKAQALLRDLRKANPNQTRTVMLRGGTYYLALSATDPGTLKFTAYDSATAANRTTWQNYPGETPIISGGVPVRSWTHTSGSLWQSKLPADTKPFGYLFYNGERRLRARVQSPAGVGYFIREGKCYATQTKQPVDISQCNLGTFLRIAAEIPAKGGDAGCPAVARTDKPSVSKCLDRFVYDPKDPIAQWANLHANDTSCAPASGPSAAYPAGDVEVTIFNGWTVDVMRVSCVDTTRHVIYFSGPAKADSVNYDAFGPVAGHRYIVENAKDAFDTATAAGQTGLWFVDRSTTPWTLSYVANKGEDPNRDTVVIAQVQPVSPIGGSLISAVYLDCVTFRGITFEIDNYIPPDLGFANDEVSDDTLPEAIDCISCQDVTFDNITVRHTSASGILLASGSGDIDRPPMDNKVVNSAFYDIGSSGIRIGRHPIGSDRSNHVVQFVTIENNIVQGYSRVFADGIGMSEANGHDVTYRYNDITDGYHSGISVCLIGCPAHNANGFNTLVQYNHIWNVMQGITSNGGAIYFNTGNQSGAGAGNRIANNLIHDVTDSSVIDKNIAGYGFGGYGLQFDNQSAAIQVEHNVVYRTSDAAVAIDQGPPRNFGPIQFRNNIFADARKTMFRFAAPWSPNGCEDKTMRVSFVGNIFAFGRGAAAQVMDACRESCGLAHNQFEKFEGNLYWRAGGGMASSKPFASRCDLTSEPLTFADWQKAGQDASGTVSIDPVFGDKYLLSKNPIKGFDFLQTNDTIRKAGRNHPVIQPPRVPPTFPTFQP